MQIDKQPSPWPCVVMLAGLLLFCLAAPYYWQQDTSPVDTGTSFQASTTNNSNSNSSDAYSRSSTEPSLPDSNYDLSSPWLSLHEPAPNGDLLSAWGPPTIDQLIAARSTYGLVDGGPHSLDPQAFEWSRPENRLSIDSSSLGHASGEGWIPANDWSSYASNSVEIVAALLARYSSSNWLPKLVTRIADAMPVDLFAGDHITPVYSVPNSASSSVRLVNPNDRLAMLLPRTNANTWCVPQTLDDQLQRLAVPAYSAQWASQVSYQLHSLTEREQLAGDDVQAILANLSDAAEDAVRMAENTDDDRLRVELLRAHWALARRLDCWVAMHEERVAYHFQGRVAARGELSPYFDSAPSESPTPAEVVALDKNLEAYEVTRDPQIARQVIAQQKVLAASPASFDRALADAVEQHYRNANIRLALTAEMINRALKSDRSESRPVRNQIGGAYVRGQSEICSHSRVELAPSDDEWRLKVQTNGVVQSNTFADAGSVRLRSRGATDFSGSKTVVVRPDGVHMQPSDVDATSRNRLVGVTTDYDWMPLVGGYARDRAMQEYQARQNRVRTEMESRVSGEASDTLDRDTHDAMEQARKNLYARFTEHFDEYGIKLTTIEMKSSPERLVARVRVASDDQLGSHTPRPRALSDSLASLQIHETAMTNLAVTLGLDGQRLTGAELQNKIHEQFPKMAMKDPQEIRRDTVFQFAPKNSVQVHIKDGRLELAIAFDSVELDGDTMPNVIVHAFYTPSAEGLNADLARDGSLGIEGRFSSTERARLHNIFQTVLSPDRKLTIARLGDQTDLNLKGLMITQLVLEDGWVGLAIGPESTNRVAERSRSLK